MKCLLNCTSVGYPRSKKEVIAMVQLVIWDRKMLHPDMSIGEIPGTFNGLTANGWMDQELFENWLKSHF